jgi:predicted esterase
VASADCRGLDDPRDRVERLVEVARPLAGPLVLVGSSLGAWTAVAASARLRPALLFLMAPAFHMPGLPDPEPEPEAGHIVVTHGWRDEVVPMDKILGFARRYRAETHVFDADHRLIDALPQIGRLLAENLESLAGV